MRYEVKHFPKESAFARCYLSAWIPGAYVANLANESFLGFLLPWADAHDMLLGMETQPIRDEKLVNLLERLQFALSEDKHYYFCPVCNMIVSGSNDFAGHSFDCVLAQTIVRYGGTAKFEDRH